MGLSSKKNKKTRKPYMLLPESTGLKWRFPYIGGRNIDPRFYPRFWDPINGPLFFQQFRTYPVALLLPSPNNSDRQHSTTCYIAGEMID